MNQRIDPLTDDLNPGQDNPDPLAGQNFLQAGDGGVQGGPGWYFTLCLGAIRPSAAVNKKAAVTANDSKNSLFKSIWFP